jgi:hypothetical protein
MPRRPFFAVVALLLTGLTGTFAPAAEPSLEALGMFEMPDTVAGPNDTKIPLVGLSGITWLGESTWAAVLDNSDLMITFTLDLSADGKPLGVSGIELKKIAARHDYEDIAPCPPALQKRISGRLEKRGLPAPGRCVLICDEDTPAIRGMAIADGRLLGAVPLPEIVKRCRPNKGLESLSVEPDGSRIWTANEEAFATDGPESGRSHGTVIRLIAIPTPRDSTTQAAADSTPPDAAQFAYQVDPPHEMVAIDGQMPLSGVSALAALGGGKLLVLERSGGVGLPPFENRIYLVDTAGGQDVSGVESLATTKAEPLKKKLLWKDSLGCNVEGLALGPDVKGGRAVVGIADNGHVGGKTPLVFLRIK